jgi:hypothetical protein
MPTSVPALRVTALGVVSALLLAVPAILGAGDAERPSLAGAWTLNKSLSTPAGSVPSPDGGPDVDAIGGGGAGRRGGFGGGRGGRGPAGGRGPGGAGQRADMAARRGLIEELMGVPPSVTIVQDGDRLAFTEPDGVVRVYHANNRTEKHQLLNGTIETKARWDEGSLVMELKPRGGMTITRRYTLRPGAPAQLEVTTRADRDRKGVTRIAVYELADSGESPATAPDRE